MIYTLKNIELHGTMYLLFISDLVRCLYRADRFDAILIGTSGDASRKKIRKIRAMEESI